MKIAVVGANGQVAKEIVRAAARMKYDVAAFGRNELDITNYSNVSTLISEYQPQIVINAAAYTAVDLAEKECEMAFRINRDGPAQIALVCEEHSIPLFHISTDYVFDGEHTDAYREHDISNPMSVYGKSKYEGDLKVTAIKKHIILRVAWVFSAHGNNFVKTMLRLGNERPELGIVHDQFGGPTPAYDIASTLIKLCQRYFEENNLAWGLYHYCGTPEVSWYDFSHEIFKQAKALGLMNTIPELKPIPASDYPVPAKRPANSRLNCEKIEATFGITQPDWRSGLSSVLKELKNNES